MKLKEIIADIRRELSFVKEELSDEDAKLYIEKRMMEHHDTVDFTIGQLQKIVMRIFYAIRNELSILAPYVMDDEVNEVMVNGKDNIFIEKNGKIEKIDETFESVEELEEVIRRIVSRVNREINELNPIVDARLEDGSRVNAVYKNIALNGPILTIRKFPKSVHSMEDLINLGTITRECAEYLKTLVKNGYNCFISGGTTSGKTTFLNVLSRFIPAEERLIKTALRMRPDRIIVGEVRGKEVLDMINAMNTGHSGSLSTGHGNSITGMLRRLESMYLQAADFPIDAVRSQIAEGIDIIIHLGKLDNKERKVLEIAEIYSKTPGELEVNSLFRYSREDGLKATGSRLISREKLELNGEEIIEERSAS